MKTQTPNFLLMAPKLGIAILAALTLSGCLAVPVAVQIQGQHGTYGYSSKRGVEIELNATK